MIRDELKAYEMPDTPGVYVFRDLRRRILYIGKATSLRDRVRSYFATDLREARSSAIVKMVEEAKLITWEETDSVLEALILEANLIKKHQPPFNVREKDNKSFNYLVITNEAFPRVLTVRGRELFQNWNDSDIKHLFGPFPEGGSLKEALKLVRHIFPYRDTCVPNNGRPCFNRQIGLCPGVCSGEMPEAIYAKTIRHIVALFSGKKKALLKDLERDMRAAAKAEEFERAAVIRRQIGALTHIRDVALIKRSSRESTGGSSTRIEGYDIAHTGGSETVGVMVVIFDGEISKSDIRKFKIRTVTNNDPAALAEVVSRRLGHSEWPLPRLFVIDGAKAQVTAVERVLAAAGIEIPVVGVVKDEKHRPKSFIGRSEVIKSYQREILLADDEAHKRAIGFHRARRSKRQLGLI
jgi:excinuclease ABC subunit C